MDLHPRRPVTPGRGPRSTAREFTVGGPTSRADAVKQQEGRAEVLAHGGAASRPVFGLSPAKHRCGGEHRRRGDRRRRPGRPHEARPRR
jgi:hypothetical protein